MRTIILMLLCFYMSTAYSQTKTDSVQSMKKVVVKMKNGEEYKGIFIQKNENIIVLKTDNGEMNLIATNVASIIEDKYKGNFRFENNHDTRYFFGPSGIGIKRNKGYYQNLMLTSNFVNYGISDNISIGGGFEFISAFYQFPIWFVTPKISFEISENINAGVGVFFAGFSTFGTSALGYGVITLGESESNLSVGMGFGYMNDGLSKRPPIMISGMHRITNGVALLSENYLIPSSNGKFNLLGIEGIRILSPKSSFDLGVFVAPGFSDNGAILPIPFVGYARSF